MSKSPEAIARELVSSLQGVLGSRLQCATLYGSAARGEYIEGESNVNVMVLLDDIDAATLAKAAPIAQKWAKAGHLPPLILELEQWRRAADVFAIELADMRDAHLPLHGAECVTATEIVLADLRSQAERELRGKLLQLQTGMLMNAGAPDALGKLLKSAMPSFSAYLRAALRMSGQPGPGNTTDVIEQGAALVGTPAEAWLEVWQARTQRRPLKLSLQDSIVNQYHAAAEQTAVFVDNLREVGQ